MADTPDTPDTPKGERIAKVIARAGVASRREAERMIEIGQVRVNGAVIDSPALNVTPRDRIEVDGAPLAPPEPARLWLFHKPTGLVTTDSDELDRPTIYQSLPEDMPRVMSVGRLDLNSEGLLLLTNDGGIKRQLELPSTGWLRRYRVRVNGRPTEDTFRPLRAGITADGEHFQPMSVSLDRQQGANAWLTVGLREGKNREIRRAMEAIGLSVNRLIRISYGPFQLGDLKPGAVEEVRRKTMRDQLGLSIEEIAPLEGKPPARAVRRGGAKGAGKPSGKPAGKSPSAAQAGAAGSGGKSAGGRFAKAAGRGRAARDDGDAPWSTGPAGKSGKSGGRGPQGKSAPSKGNGPKEGGYKGAGDRSAGGKGPSGKGQAGKGQAGKTQAGKAQGGKTQGGGRSQGGPRGASSGRGAPKGRG
ncbi:pseudouridine synthase [Litorivita sp. NS0012-18]|uniref:pseudouridine synthase n=1 Tax=Litorivita sp. NS0012-18 TaxID=3127655 RepID=UPI003104AA20